MIELEAIGFGLLALLAFVATGLFAGSETGVYTLNPVRLAVRAARGDPAAVRLRRELDNPGRVLATLLIGTNAFSYLASYSLAEILHRFGLTDWTLIAVEAAIFTPLLFIFAETLPKDLFRTHTDHWTYRLSAGILLCRRLFTFTGLLPIVRSAAMLIGRLMGARSDVDATARQHISQLIKEGVDTGVLTESQTTIADRALSLRDRTVASEMVPWSQVHTVPLDADAAARDALIRRHEHRRLPVVDGSGRTVVGILSTLDVLLDPAAPTGKLMTEAMTFEGWTSLREALRAMRTARRAMAVVVDGATGRARGIVTLKDLVEPITGELVAW